MNENEKLIEKFESVANEYAITLRELTPKLLNKELTEEQIRKVESVSLSLSSNVFDMMISDGADKKMLSEMANDLVNKCTDENR